MNNLNYSKPLLALIFCLFIAGNSFSMTSVNTNTKQLVVVIDPGHGGKDPGAVNKSIREKDIVLGIGLKLGKLINEAHPDVKVVYTRSTDVFVPLIERSRIANKNKADLFISLHANACGTPATKGTETFVLGLHRSNDNLEVAKKENSVILLEEDYTTTYEGFDPNLSESYIMFELVQDLYMDQSLIVADAIQQQFSSRINSPNRGVKQAGFLVLRQASMPSVLVEAGFLSNLNEANYLNSELGQRDIALSVFEAFKKFKDKTSGASNVKSPEIVAKNEKKQEVAPKQEVRAENKKKTEIAVQAVTEEKNKPETEKTIITPDTTAKGKSTENSIYYSVQIGANTTPIDPVASNFKGLKNVRREKTDKYYRYYFGNEKTIEKITVELKQIKQKFPQAFIVSFVNGQRVPLN
ncbi:MAG: N-acetylmuramoyl-L-alanine amidase [Bacteroidota bacterium]|nr:N-acetylmuramoyl-L-alanine amidase [Bacteroidota bacterium]